MKTLKAFVLATLLSLAYGCSHPIEIVGEGDVLSATGTRHCYYEDYLAGAESCSKNLVVQEYVETYYAEPREGWRFEKWLNYSHCADTGNECAFDIPADAVKIGWGQTMPSLLAVFAKNAPPPPEPLALFSYALDAAGGLLNPQPLEGAHLQRRSAYFSFTGEYSKVNFWCCKVADADQPHMPKVADLTAPFVLRVDTGALEDDGGLQRELYADLFDSNGDFAGHYAYWTLQPPPTSPITFDDGTVHTIDYTIEVPVETKNFTTLNLLAGSNLESGIDLLGSQDGALHSTSRVNVYGGKLASLSSTFFAANGQGTIVNFDIQGGTVGSIYGYSSGPGTISGGTVGSIRTEYTNMVISGGTIGTMNFGCGFFDVTGGTFNGETRIGEVCHQLGHLSVKGGKFNAGFTLVPENTLDFYGDLKLTVLGYGLGGADFSIVGTLLDGTELSQTITAACLGEGSDDDPCPGAWININP
jgi:hypothetical protein